MFLILFVPYYAKILAPFNIGFFVKKRRQDRKDRNHILTNVNYSCYIRNVIKYGYNNNLIIDYAIQKYN